MVAELLTLRDLRVQTLKERREGRSGGRIEGKKKEGRTDEGIHGRIYRSNFSRLPADVVFATASGSQNEMRQQSLQCLGGAIAHVGWRPSMETKNSKLFLG